MILLPDARILLAGGDNFECARDLENECHPGDPSVTRTDADLFKPPYLFDTNGSEIDDGPGGARPRIDSAPATISYNGSLTITTGDAALVSKVSLVRLGASTHSFDQNTRYLSLEFTSGLGTVTAASPAQPNLAPPGHYMLFILVPSGRPGIEYPSVARIVKLG
jgi:hypothetical protein